MTDAEKIRKAIEILGRPTMGYVPEIAAKEYARNIHEVVKLLLEVLG